jgi:hypothetical protein
VSARTRLVLGVIAALLTIASAVVLRSQPTNAQSTRFVTTPSVLAAPVTIPSTTTTTTSSPPATTTSTAAPVVVHRPSATTAPPASPPVTKAPAPPIHTSGTESCGWAWDATHMDDGFSDEVVITLDAPRRPNALVTIQAVPHGSNVPIAKAVTTDLSGSASALFKLTADKRDWTVTVSAQFATGSACAAQTFTINYL